MRLSFLDLRLNEAQKMAKKVVAPAPGILPRQGIVFILLVLAVQVNGNQYFKMFAKGKVYVFFTNFP